MAMRPSPNPTRCRGHSFMERTLLDGARARSSTSRICKRALAGLPSATGAAALEAREEASRMADSPLPPTDLVLHAIRKEIAGTNERLDATREELSAGLKQTNERLSATCGGLSALLDQTNERLDDLQASTAQLLTELDTKLDRLDASLTLRLERSARGSKASSPARTSSASRGAYRRSRRTAAHRLRTKPSGIREEAARRTVEPQPAARPHARPRRALPVRPNAMRAAARPAWPSLSARCAPRHGRRAPPAAPALTRQVGPRAASRHSPGGFDTGPRCLL
jgi:hypothetical protein